MERKALSRSERLSGATRVLLLCACVDLWGCAVVRKRGILPEYRLQAPKEQLAEVTWMLSTASNELSARLSPDGKRLVYSSDQKGEQDIWVKDLTNGMLTRLTKHDAIDTQPAWLPDGSGVVFVSMREDAKGDLYLWRSGQIVRLTDGKRAESYPVVAAGGRWIYFVQGLGSARRIRRMPLDGGVQETVVEKTADHPDLSPDGRYLAYTRFGGSAPGRIMVKSLGRGAEVSISSGMYPAGFPTFNDAGNAIAFVRFHRGPPNRKRGIEATASLWRVSLSRDSMQPVRPVVQLTSDRWTYTQPHWHGRSLIFTARGRNGLDIGAIEAQGVVPKRTKDALRRLANDQRNPWDRLLCLFHAAALVPRGHERGTIDYRRATLLLRQGEWAKADTILRTLKSDPAYGRAHHLAKIDLTSFVGGFGGRRRKKADLRRARAELGRFQTADDYLAAYRLLKVADIDHRLGAFDRAREGYERVVRQYGRFADLAAEAELKRGSILVKAGDAQGLARYYVRVLERYPRQQGVAKRASSAILDLLSKRGWSEQVSQLSLLSRRYAGHKEFAVASLKKLASLYKERALGGLAVEAILQAMKLSGPSERARLTLELGRIAMAHSTMLRKRGAQRRALRYYDQALGAYENLLKEGNVRASIRRRARSEYLRLTILAADQLEADGEVALAEKRYRALVSVDPDALQGHRGLVRLLIRRGTRLDALVERYRVRLARDERDYAARYMLGYLATHRPELASSDLAYAERMVLAAAAIRPRDAIPQLTLGWIYELRERLLGERSQGWLEEALLRYERAYTQHDATVDPRGEADILTNLVNAFAALGGNWNEASRLCSRRRAIGFGFSDARREAFHRLNCGRAAMATGRHRAATENLERAQQIAERLGLKQLAFQAVSRLALNEHLRGDFAASNRLFRLAIQAMRGQGQEERIAGVFRTMAYNAVLLGDRKQARKWLGRAERALASLGAPRIAPFLAIATQPGASEAPLGFDQHGEADSHQAIHEILAERESRWDVARSRQVERARMRVNRAMEKVPTPASRRELALIANRVALTNLYLERQGGDFFDELERALHALKPPEDEELAAIDWQIRAGIAINGATYLLSYSTKNSGRIVARQFRRLLDLERNRSAWREQHDQSLLSLRTRVSLWTALALLADRVPERASLQLSNLPVVRKSNVNSTAGPGTPQKGKKDRITRALDAAHQVARVRLAQLMLLQRAHGELVHGVAEDNDLYTMQESRDGTVFETLQKELSPQMRKRWRAIAALNLSRMMSRGVRSEMLSDHPATSLLATARLQYGLRDALGLVLEAELAFNKGDSEASDRILAASIARSPLHASTSYVTGSPAFRSELYNTILDVGIANRDALLTLRCLESRDRRVFVDDLLALPPRAIGHAAPLLKRVLVRVQELREVQAKRNANDASIAQLKEKLAVAERDLRKHYPAVAQLFQIGRFPVDEFGRALGTKAIAMRAFVHRGKPWLLVANLRDGKLAVEIERFTRARLRKRIQKAVESGLRVYLDRDDALRADREPKAESGLSVTRIATFWHLVEAQRMWRPANGVVADMASLDGSGGMSQGLRHAGTLLVSAPVRFDGYASANLRIDRGARRSVRMAFSLGIHLPVAVVGFQSKSVADLGRAQQVALGRLLCSMGAASWTVLSTTRPLSMAKRALAAENWEEEVRSLGGEVWGIGQIVDKSQRQATAIDRLKHSIRAGASAFKKKAYADAVHHLNRAVYLMDYLKQSKYLQGALSFLSAAHGLRHEYVDALFYAGRLLRLRDKALQKAKRANVDSRSRKQRATKNKALASVIKSQTDLAWLFLRKKSYKRALEHNQRAVDHYAALKRPLLVATALDQRAVIAEQAGKRDVALVAAKASFRNSAKKLAVGVDTARRATTVARLLRQRFSRFAAAARWNRVALKAAPQVDLDGKPRDGNRTAGDRARVMRRAALKERVAKEKAVVRVRARALLEQSRLATARGQYRRAVELAGATARLSEKGGLKAVASRLARINNLYYLGSYQRAFEEAEHLLKSGVSAKRRIQLLNAQGTALAALGYSTKALRILYSARRLAQKSERQEELSATYNNIGDALRRAGRYRKARRAFTRALVIDRAASDVFGSSLSLANRGIAQFALGLRKRAQVDLLLALKGARQIGAPRTELKALAGLARLALQRGRLKSAASYIEDGSVRSRALGRLSWLWRFLFLRSKVLHKQGHRYQALKALKLSVDILEHVPPMPLGSTFSHDAEEVPGDAYDWLVELTAEQSLAKDALLASLAFRRRRLKDLLGGALERFASNPSEQKTIRLVLDATERYRLAMAAWMRMPDEQHRRRYEQAAVDQHKLLHALSGKARRLLSPLRRSTSSLAEAEAWARKSDHTLLVFHSTKDRLVRWRLDASGLSMSVRRQSRRELSNLVREFNRRMLAFHPLEHVGRKLGRILLGTDADAARAAQNSFIALARRVAVIHSTGLLAGVPFAALHDGRDYFVGRYAFERVFLTAVTPAPNTSGEHASWTSFSVSGTGDRAASSDMKASDALSLADSEAAALGRAVGRANLFKGTEATPTAFLERLERVENLHVAGHFSANARWPFQGKLHLSGGSVAASDVLARQTAADLVVLSACETAMRQDREWAQDVAGSSGLQLAFAVSGARRVVATLSRISDLGAALVMKHFFRELSRGRGLVQALAASQNRVRQMLPHPGYWAPFVFSSGAAAGARMANNDSLRDGLAN